MRPPIMENVSNNGKPPVETSMRDVGLRTRLAWPWLVRRLPPCGRDAVLLTFDDGPTAGVTDAVLDRLAIHGARALFFVVGRHVEESPDLARRIVEEGHVLGNHSHRHRMEHWPSLSSYQADLDRCQHAVSAATGREPAAFRAPGGRMHAASVLAPRRRGLPHVHWSVDPRDYAAVDDDAAAALGERLGVEIRGRDIVLLHDAEPRVLALLDVLLPLLTARGLDLAGGVGMVVDAGGGS